MAMASGVLVKLARALAHPELETRLKALRVVKGFLLKTRAISHDELMKLWKGLFYCMWMSDKPAVQQELAESLASLAHIGPPADGLRFVGAFYATMGREWAGIDRLRMDKYYYLLRQMLRASFTLLRDAHWAVALVTQWNLLLEVHVLQPGPLCVAGLCLQVVDYWTAELAAVATEQSRAPPDMSLLMEPLMKLLRDTDRKVVATRLREKWAEELLSATVLGVNEQRWAEDVLTLASSASVDAMNRAALYALRKRLVEHLEQRAEAAPTRKKLRPDPEEAPTVEPGVFVTGAGRPLVVAPAALREAQEWLDADAELRAEQRERDLEWEEKHVAAQSKKKRKAAPLAMAETIVPTLEPHQQNASKTGKKNQQQQQQQQPQQQPPANKRRVSFELSKNQVRVFSKGDSILGRNKTTHQLQ